MKQIKVIIEQADNNLCAYLEGIDGIVTTGNTEEEIKTNMAHAISVFTEECQYLDCELPAELMVDYELIFEWAK